MWKKITAIGALAAAMTAAPALAQQTPSDQAQPPAATEPQPANPEPQADQGAAMGDLVGMDVWSADDQKLGEVTKTNLSADGSVESIYVEMGSVLGIGGKTVKITPEQFTQTEDRIDLALTAEAADALPEVEDQ